MPVKVMRIEDAPVKIMRWDRGKTLRLVDEADGANNVDASILKIFDITESVRLQFRCEFFNLLNHPVFNQPERNPTSSNFGRITSQANEATRAIQMGLRLTW